MSDEFLASRLPDMPNSGYSTTREKQVTDLTMQMIRMLERDRLTLLDIVAGGRPKFRRIAGRALAALHVDSDYLDSVFGYLALLAGPNPEQQRDQLLSWKWAPPWLTR